MRTYATRKQHSRKGLRKWAINPLPLSTSPNDSRDLGLGASRQDSNLLPHLMTRFDPIVIQSDQVVLERSRGSSDSNSRMAEGKHGVRANCLSQFQQSLPSISALANRRWEPPNWRIGR